jgi:hypothetical protein
MKLCVVVACCIAAVAIAAPTGIAAGKRSGSTKVVCISGRDQHREYKRKPTRCTFHKHGEPMAEAFFVRTRHDHWHVWHRSHARGKGRDVTPMGQSRPPVRIRLSDPVERCGHRVFSKAHFFFPRTDSGSTMRLDVCA